MLHFILTRFNIRLWQKDKYGVQTLTEEWLKSRCDLFETYTLPSVAAQTCHDFKWLILFDDESPSWLRDRVGEWCARLPQLVPIWVKREGGYKMQDTFQRMGKSLGVVEYSQLLFCNAIAQHVKMDTRVITSYLDNDDALNKDFVAVLQQKAADVSHNTVLSFTPGLQYYTSMGIGMSMDYRNNHFISLVEDVEVGKPFRTVFGFGGHYHILKENRTQVEILNTSPQMMWVEVIHDNNVDNDVKMTSKQHLVTDLKSHESNYAMQLPCSSWPRLVWCFRWLPRFVYQFFRRLWHKMFGHNWNY